jgi:hypothetical protein
VGCSAEEDPAPNPAQRVKWRCYDNNRVKPTITTDGHDTSAA